MVLFKVYSGCLPIGLGGPIYCVYRVSSYSSRLVLFIVYTGCLAVGLGGPIYSVYRVSSYRFRWSYLQCIQGVYL